MSDSNKNKNEGPGDRLRPMLGLDHSPKDKNGKSPKQRLGIWYGLIAMVLSSYLQPVFFSGRVETIPYSQFELHLTEGTLDNLIIGPENITATLKGVPDQQISTIRVDDPGLVKELTDSKVSYSGKYQNRFLGTIFSWLLPLGIFLLFFFYAMKKMGPGTGVMSFSRNKAKIFAESDTNVSFADVAGIDEAQEELEEVVAFLSSPEKSQKKLGGRIPKGVLLVGPPGTGKMLLARVVAGEAKVPFFSIPDCLRKFPAPCNQLQTQRFVKPNRLPYESLRINKTLTDNWNTGSLKTLRLVYHAFC